MGRNFKKIFIFFYEIMLSILRFIENHVTNYVTTISREVNEPTTDFFERFYYNFFILLYWIVKNVIFSILKFKKYVSMQCKLKKIKIYELTFGNKNFKLSTPKLFYSILKDLPNDSNILDFGCGSGTCYKNEDIVNFIIKTNQNITGIDINSFAIEEFKKNIELCPLAERLNLRCGDVFAEKFNKKFDYVIFSESAPLLENIFVVKVIDHIKTNLLNSNGKIFFINNLVENPQFFVSLIKPKLKYITALDFGRILTVDDFKIFATKNEMSVKFEVLDSMTVEEIAIFFKIPFIYKIVKIFGFKNYDVKQYKIVME